MQPACRHAATRRNRGRSSRARRTASTATDACTEACPRARTLAPFLARLPRGRRSLGLARRLFDKLVEERGAHAGRRGRLRHVPLMPREQRAHVRALEALHQLPLALLEATSSPSSTLTSLARTAPARAGRRLSDVEHVGCLRLHARGAYGNT